MSHERIAPAQDSGQKRDDVQQRLMQRVAAANEVERIGRVADAFGTLVRVTGIKTSIGELCELTNPDGDFHLLTEAVGIANDQTLLTPLGSLQGMSCAAEVVATGRQATVGVGDQLMGRILDAHGEPIDDLGPVRELTLAPVYAASPNPLRRKLISKEFATGVRAIDTVLTLGEGQRIGVFAAAGGGKSTLLAMLARGGNADVNVIVLIGERGREVGEFIHYHLGKEGLRQSVVVVATSDRPAMERSRAAYVGTAIAEHFRERGKRVLLLVDSITRFARALRDVGLAVGEPPIRRGFPPSVFSALPLLFERAGNSDKGTMTAVYNILVEDEDEFDPIVEEARSILDGHIRLSRQLAAAGHYPAIDILDSVSRVMPRVVSQEHLDAAVKVRKCLAKYQEIELLIQLGEYQPGKDQDADMAIDHIDAIRKMLQQSEEESFSFDEGKAAVTGLFR